MAQAERDSSSLMADTSQLLVKGNALQLFRRGLAAAAMGHYRQAIAAYNQALELSPDYADLWYERGMALEKLGLYEEAIADYDAALRLQPEAEVACEIWHSRGNALQYGIGDYQAALLCYDRALHLQSTHALVWYDRGNALLYGCNRPPEAIHNYEQALLHLPEHLLSWRHRGNAFMQLQHYQEALDSYEQALLLDPGDPASLHGRSCALRHVGLEEQLPTTNPEWYGRGYSEVNPLTDLSEADLMEWETLLVQENAACSRTLQLHPVFVVEDERGRREYSLTEATYSVGRDPDSDIQLYSRFVSRHHATLIQFPSVAGGYTYRIVDGTLAGKRSTNGILVGGKKQEMRDLCHEDQIVFGSDVKAMYLQPLQHGE